MLVSEVVGEAVWRQHPKPKQLPIPKQSKPKLRPKLQQRPKPRPFNEPKSDELS
jgi:hypothetical protein